MSESTRISLSNVGLSFRMSYHKPNNFANVALQFWKRTMNNWQPEYFVALQNISLKIKMGEIIGVLGRNGSGKSTLLRTIAGIYSPDFGTVKVYGRISALLQLGTGFNINLSGRENIILGGLTLGLSLEEIHSKLEWIIEFAEIGDFINIPMRYYSSGMMSRLSFAIVVAVEPDILLIDETLSVGDLGFQKKSKQAMSRLLEKASCQLIVSHDMETIRRLCTRAILVEGGKLIADDSPEKVISQYQKMMNIREEILLERH